MIRMCFSHVGQKSVSSKLKSHSRNSVLERAKTSPKKGKHGKTISFEKKMRSSASSCAVQLKKMVSDPTSSVEIPAGGTRLMRKGFFLDLGRYGKNRLDFRVVSFGRQDGKPLRRLRIRNIAFVRIYNFLRRITHLRRQQD